MTRISRDSSSLAMQQSSKKNGTYAGVETTFDSVGDSNSGTNAPENGKYMGCTARNLLAQYPGRKEASSSLTSLPDIKTNLRRKIGYIRSKSTNSVRPKLHRSKTETFKDTSDLKWQIFEQLKLQSQEELNGNSFPHKRDSDSCADGISSRFNSILERNYSNEVDDTDSELGYTSSSYTPYFSQWKISGFKNDKVILTSLTSMTDTQEATPEFVQYIKERDTAVDDAKKAQSELRETQSKLYDSMLLVEELEKKLKDAESKHKTHKTTGKRATTAKKKSTATPSPRGSIVSVRETAKGSSSAINSGSTSLASIAHAVDRKLYHPPVEGLEPVPDSREFYWKLAEKFPTLPMFQVLDAEKKFIKADTDNSGYIEKAELDKVLSDNVGLFTPDQLDAIFKEVDLDNSETLDFHEVLFVINKLFTRRRTNLPQSVQQNYSKTCNIQ